MANPEQVGGLQDVFIQVNGRGIAGINRAVKLVEEFGGRLRHAYPPRTLVAAVPVENIGKLVGQAGIVSANTGAVELAALRGITRETRVAIDLWNHHLSAERQLRALATPYLGASFDSPNVRPPDPPAEIAQLLRQRERELAPVGAPPELAAGAPNLNIPVLVGRVAVGLIYVDSTVTAYKITDQEKSKVLSETIEGLDVLANFEPRAKIQWFYDIKRPKISLPASQFTGANQNSWEDMWRNAALQAMGYTPDLNGMNSYINSIKAKTGAQWAYAVFVTKYPKFWFAYEWANHVVMDFGVDGWGIDNFHIVLAHETGHVFGCTDEYASSGCNCTSLGGRYQVPNGNCEKCASPFVQCLMAHNSPAVCDYTRGQLGWNELAVQSEGATTLKGTWTFDFDQGVQGPATGADIWWEQIDQVNRLLVPTGGAAIANLGKPNFDAVSLQTLKAQPYAAVPINGSNTPANQLTPGTVVAIKTDAGRFSKMRVKKYGYNLDIDWVTYK